MQGLGLGLGAGIRDAGVGHIGLLHAAAALAETSCPPCTIRQHLDDVASHLLGLILHVVSCASLQIGIACEPAGEEISSSRWS